MLDERGLELALLGLYNVLITSSHKSALLSGVAQTTAAASDDNKATASSDSRLTFDAFAQLARQFGSEIPPDMAAAAATATLAPKPRPPPQIRTVYVSFGLDGTIGQCHVLFLHACPVDDAMLTVGSR